MIRRKVSAVLLLRDGFTHLPVTDLSGVLCTLDDRPYRPIGKPGGYLVLCDLAPGAHALTIRRYGYREERMRVASREGALREELVELRPDERYPLPRDASRVALRLQRERRPLTAQALWLGMPLPTAVKLGAARGGAPENELAVFCEGSADRLPVPGAFLISDGADAELVSVRRLRGETMILDAPPTRRHPRGTELIAVQPYRTDENGLLRAAFRFPGTLWAFFPGQTKTFAVRSGEQELVWEL